MDALLSPALGFRDALAGLPAERWLLSAAVFAAVFGAGWVLRSVLLAWARLLAKTAGADYAEGVEATLGRVGWLDLSLVALAVSVQGLPLHAAVEKAVRIVVVAGLTARAVRLLQAASGIALHAYFETRRDPHLGSAVQNLQWLASLVLWVLGGLFVLDNVGVNVTAMVAGLGVGGIAIAMASQQILGDLFSSFALFLDKPFRVGEFINLGELSGTVEHIGVKTTRIRSLSGELLIFPNQQLTSARIRNFGDLRERRVVFQVGIVYETPRETAARVPELLAQAVRSQGKARLERAHFLRLGDSALVYEAAYHVLDPDYGVYMDVQQAINLALMASFEREKIAFAYPTQTLHLRQA